MKTMMAALGVFLSMSTSQADSALPSTCDQLKGHSFTSYNDHPLGENLKGPVLGKLTIVFAKETAELKAREDDYYVQGPYSCDSAEGHFVIDKGGTIGKWIGYFQPEAKVILFQGNWYKQTD